MLKASDRVGPYEIRGFLGQGGMGRVYEAYDPRLERRVALKVIHVPDAHEGDAAAQRLVAEFSARLYLAMEFVVGSTLRSLVGEDVPPARKLRWLIDVARALGVAHRAGLIHRDVKPENVMIREDGAVKVLDFGIARRTITSGSDDDQRKLDTVTGGNAITGTPVYMAPEQIRGHDVDARCDQFAWGVMAYELLVGHRPWADTGDVLSFVAKVLSDPPRAFDAPAMGLSLEVGRVIERSLSKDADARFASMDDVADALEPHASSANAQERVRITPPRRGVENADASAFAATTKVPTSVSFPPARTGAQSALSERAPTERRTKRKLAQLAIPIALLVALASVVVVVRRRTTNPVPNPPPVTTARRPLSAVPDAETAYHEAMRLWRDGATARARAALGRAIELDPTFAAAHLELAVQTADDDPAFSHGAFQRAFEHRQLLVARDAVMLEAFEPFMRSRPDLDEWETRFAAVVFQYPRDPELQYFLGRARGSRGDDEGAKAAYDAALRLDPSFMPAHAARASAENNLGLGADALTTTERCIKASPIASVCIETRFRLLAEMGECHRAREEAAEWRTLEPTSPHAVGALARALFADGAPRPSIEEALTRAWALAPVVTREADERWDRMHLAIIDGELTRADELARDFEAALAPSADQLDHALPSRVRVSVLQEAGDLEGAAKVARTYLDRRDAWPAYPFAADPSIAFYETLYRASEITKPELERQRTRWVERERARLAGEAQTSRTEWGVWTVWGTFAESREEALEALARVPDLPPPVGSRRTLSLDFALGKAFALASRGDDAVAPLLRVTRSCLLLDDPLMMQRARYYLGMAHESAGRTSDARAAYESLLEAWPKDVSARIAKKARYRLEALEK